MSPQPQTPTTPSQFAKLKLKGKLLMKRSMSIEKMEREKAMVQGGAIGTPTHGTPSASPLVHSGSVDVNPFSRLQMEGLQRSASIDETKLLRNKQSSVGDSNIAVSPLVQAAPAVIRRPSLNRTLSNQSLTPSTSTPRQARLQRSLSIHEEPMEIEESRPEGSPGVVVPATQPSATALTQLPGLPQNSLIVDEKSVVDRKPEFASLNEIPVNLGETIIRAGEANMAPYFKHCYSQPKDAAPLLVNAPIKLKAASEFRRQESKKDECGESSTSTTVSTPIAAPTTAVVSPTSGNAAKQPSTESSATSSSPEAGVTPGDAQPTNVRLMSEEMGAGNGRLSEKAQVSCGWSICKAAKIIFCGVMNFPPPQAEIFSPSANVHLTSRSTFELETVTNFPPPASRTR